MDIISNTAWGMQIRTPLEPLNLSRVDAIALHHMAHPAADIYEVQRWHLNQGWRAFGYNYWVGFDGTIYEGRGLHMGAGVANQNDHIISKTPAREGCQSSGHKPHLMFVPLMAR